MANQRSRDRGIEIRKCDVSAPPRLIEPLEARLLFSQPPLTTQPTTAYLDSVPNITSAGGTNVDVNVQFSSTQPLDPSSFISGNIVVTGPGNTALAPVGMTVNGSGSDNQYVNVDYLFSAPGGAWAAGDDGVYTVTTSSSTGVPVADLNGDPLPQMTLGTFIASIDQSNPSFPDTFTSNFSAQAIAPLAYNAFVAVGSEPDGSGAAGATQLVVEKYDNGAPDAGINGGNGQMALEYGSGSAGYGVAVQNNGDFVIAGSATDPNTHDTDFAVFRTGPDGLPDPTFGQDLNGDGTPDGIETVNVGATDSVAYADALQEDGGIIAVGTTSTDSGGNFVIARIDPVTGLLDTGFGANGYTTTSFGNDSSAGAVLIQPDNNILVAGDVAGQVALARYTPQGTLDPSFGTDGTEILPLTSSQTVGLALLPDGKILVAANDNSGGEVGVMRLNSSGATDTAFGTNGIASVATGGYGESNSIVVQPGGQIDVGGVYAFNNVQKSVLATFTASGQPENNFSGSPIDIFGSAANDDDTLGLMAPYPSGVAFAQSVGSGAGGIDGGTTVFTEPTTDAIPPTATFTATTVTTPSATASFTITYNDNVAVDPTTLGLGNITVSDGHQILQVTSATPSSETAGSPLSVTYTVAASGNTFAAADNGNYTVALAAQVKDTAGNAIVAIPDFGTLTVDEPVDPTPTPTPAPTPTPRTLLGSFGTVAGSKKSQKLTTTINGVPTVFSVTNGSGQAYLNGDNVDLVITVATGKKAAIAVAPKGGRISLGDVAVTGNVSSFAAPAGDLVGNFYISGSAGTVTIGNLSDADFDAAGAIGTIRAISLTDSDLLDGVQAGPDGTLGTSDDIYGPGVIKTITIAGAINSSVIAAGANPVNGTFGDGDDALAAPGSAIKSITAKAGTTGSTLFESGSFRSANLPKKIKSLATDPRFKVLT
jgi:uncharacterized delta-60 repeat protein